MTVLVSFPSAYPTVNKTLSIPVVVFDRLELSSKPFPSYTGAPSRTTISRIHCSSTLQRLQLAQSAILSDGTFRSSGSSFVSSNTAVATIAGDQVIGVSSGITNVTARYLAASSAPLSITVSSSSSVTITGLSLSSGLSSDTLTGQIGTTSTLSVSATFSDGSQISKIETYAWIPLTSLVVFASSDVTAITVSTSGVMTLISNFYDRVGISVLSAVCSGSSSVNNVVLVAGNVDLTSNGDVDIGATAGPPIPPVTPGTSFTYEVFIRSSSANLKSFQVLLTFDPTLMSATTCTRGSRWTGSFGCTVNDPIDRILILGSDVSSTVSGSRISVATITMLAANTNAVTRLTGVIQTLETASSVVCSSSATCSIVAGNILVEIGSVGFKKDLDFATLDVSSDVGLTRKMSAVDEFLESSFFSNKWIKAACDPMAIYGDVNLDCIFDIQDVSYTQSYFVGTPSIVSGTTATQLAKMDVTLSGGPPDAVDIQYLLSALGKKRRFLVNNSTSWVASTDTFATFSATILDDTSSPALTRTVVKFEIATVANRGVSAVYGTNRTLTTNGIMVTAQPVGVTGLYQATFSGPFVAETGVGLVILIETYDSTGQTSSGT